jgi:nitrogen PTS system EIIA component
LALRCSITRSIRGGFVTDTVMQLSNFLDFDANRPSLAAANKRALFHVLGQIAGQRLGLDPAEIVGAIADRERLGSTGFGSGVAIPHGKILGLRRIYGLFAHLAEPIDYKAIDGGPIDLVFLLLSPPDAGADHLKALAAISRVVRHAPTLEKLRGARSPDALTAVLLGVDEQHAA